jgi:hypothetical protein
MWRIFGREEGVKKMYEENKRITIMLFKVLSFTDLNYVTLIDKQTNCGILLSEGSSIDHLGNNTWLVLVTQLSFVTIKQTKVVRGHEMKFHCNKSVEIKHKALAFPSTNCPSLPFGIHSVGHRRIDINFHISCDLLCADLNDTQICQK